MKYDASAIEVLEGLEAVRRRPAMYIGGTGIEGFHHLLWEIVDNSVDEAIGGYATKIEIDLGERKASVRDNGRGIPYGKHPKSGKSALDVIFTTLHAGGKFGGDAYKTSGGLHGVGSSVVNALSSYLRVESTREGKTVAREFSAGKIKGRMSSSKARKSAHGTFVEFVPDSEIFGDLTFNLETVYQRLKVKAYLTPGTTFTLTYKGQVEEFSFSGGLSDYLADTLTDLGDALVTEFPFTVNIDEPRIQVSLAWTDSSSSNIVSFANGIPTQDGGTHVKGLDSVIVSQVRAWMGNRKDVPKRLKITPDDVREGLLAFVSVFVEDPQFQGQTKDRLNNFEVKKEVEEAVAHHFVDWLKSNSEQTDRLIHRVVQAARAMQAARDASVKVKRGSAISRLCLPGKLADCSSQCNETTELFLVEGDSAGGSAKQARDRKFQAILPLRGKILNTETASLAKVMKNEELKNIIEAVGCGIGASFDIDRRRYGKVILLMDADSDGHHITVLALTFFYRHLPELIADGRVYLSMPPLYRVNIGKETFWAKDDAHLEELLENSPRRSNPEITRFKGLGEMPPPVLKQTALNPPTRSLSRVVIPDGKALATEATISTLMGKDPGARHEMISLHLDSIEEGSVLLDT